MKDFLIVGPLGVVTYKQAFPLIKDGRMRLGVNSPKEFVMPEGNLRKFGNVYWYTTLAHDHINPPLTLTARYTPEAYPRYDNYDAVEVGKAKDVPCDYDGVMGLPISFVERWNEEQFELVGITKNWSELRTKRYGRTWCIHPDGRQELCDTLDAGANLEVPAPTKDRAYYIAGGRLYVQFYTRLLVRRRK